MATLMASPLQQPNGTLPVGCTHCCRRLSTGQTLPNGRQMIATTYISCCLPVVELVTLSKIPLFPLVQVWWILLLPFRVLPSVLWHRRLVLQSARLWPFLVNICAISNLTCSVTVKMRKQTLLHSGNVIAMCTEKLIVQTANPNSQLLFVISVGRVWTLQLAWQMMLWSRVTRYPV